MKTKLLKKLRLQAVRFIRIRRYSEDNIKCYIGYDYVRTFLNDYDFISYVTKLWHNEAKVYIDKHKRKTKRESPYIW